nr:reverse transcriptase domain-containing protein [Tanacetum cinerariifolium]
MSSSNYPFIIPSDSDIKNAFSSTNTPVYTPATPDYFLASPRNTSPDSLNNLTRDLLASLSFLPFHDDPYMKVMQAYDVTNNELPILPQALIAAPTIFPPSPMLSPLLNSRDFFRPEEILPPKKQARSQSSSSTFALLRVFENGESSHKTSFERLPPIRYEESSGQDLMAPKRTSTSAAPAMTQAAIRKLVADSVATALEAQAANMTNTDNTNRNIKPREAPVARKCSYKDFMSCQPFNFKGTEGDPIRIEEAYKVTWSEFKKLLIKKYCPLTEVKKMEDELYNLTVKGNDLKTYVRRFQELAVLCPTMEPNSKKMMEVFIEGLPRSIKGNVTASKP